MPGSRCSSFAAALARLDRKKSLVIGLPRKPLTVRREIVKTAQPVDDSTDRVHALGRPRRLAFILRLRAKSSQPGRYESLSDLGRREGCGPLSGSSAQVLRLPFSLASESPITPSLVRSMVSSDGYVCA